MFKHQQKVHNSVCLEIYLGIIWKSFRCHLGETVKQFLETEDACFPKVFEVEYMCINLRLV